MRQRWIHPEKARDYQVEWLRDLLGDWTLILCWGGLGSRRGGMRSVAVASEAAGLAQIARIGTRRRQHGYVLLSGVATEEAELLQRARHAAAPVRARHTADAALDLFQGPDG